MDKVKNFLSALLPIVVILSVVGLGVYAFYSDVQRWKSFSAYVSVQLWAEKMHFKTDGVSCSHNFCDVKIGEKIYPLECYPSIGCRMRLPRD